MKNKNFMKNERSLKTSLWKFYPNHQQLQKLIVNRHRRFTYTLVDFFCPFFSVRPSVRPLYSSLRLFYTGLFFVHPIIHFSIEGFFFASVALLFTLFYFSFTIKDFFFGHPIIHFFSIGDFFFRPILLFTSF